MLYEVNLIPAYGRDYKTPQEVLKDWIGGLDFQIADIGNRWDGRYTSCRDWYGKAVRIRFDRLGEFTILHDHKWKGWVINAD